MNDEKVLEIARRFESEMNNFPIPPVVTAEDMNHVYEMMVKYIKPGPLLLPSTANHNPNAGNEEPSQMTHGVHNEQYDEDQNSDDFWADVSESRSTDNNIAEWQVMLNGGVYKIWHYMGASWDRLIWNLHEVRPIEQPIELEVELFPHQASGVAKLKELANGPFGGGINGDEMGLGKSLTTAIACLQLKDTVKGCFSVIVTGRASAGEWMMEFEKQFKQEYRPRVYWLQDPNVTANQLFEMQLDFVVVTYQFLRSRYGVLQNYKAYHELVWAMGEAEADKLVPKSERPWPKGKRITLSLHSDCYRMLKLPFKFLILDEAHMYVKKPDSQTHLAIKALYYERCFVLSGTFVPDKWYEVFGLIDFLPRSHPFDTSRNFWRAFGTRTIEGRPGNPSRSKMNRLIKFLQAITISRPASINEIPNAVEHSQDFALNQRESTLEVYWSLKFLFAIKLKEDMKEIEKSDSNKQALSLSIRAQQYCACPAIVPEHIRKLEEKIFAQAAKMIDLFVEQLRERSPTLKATAKSDSTTLGVDEIEALIHEAQDNRSLMTLIAAVKGQKSRKKDIPNESLDQSDTSHQGFNDLADKETNRMITAPIPQDRRAFCSELPTWSDAQVFSSKVKAILDLIILIRATYPGEKVIIFSKLLLFLDVIQEAMRRRDMGIPLRFDDDMDDEARASSRVPLADSNSSCDVLLATSRAGGAAIDLTAVSHVVLSERWWCLNDVRQVTTRAVRKNQTKVVHIWYINAINSLIERLIQAMALRKTDVANKIMNGVRKRDEEEPRIPKLHKYGVGES